MKFYSIRVIEAETQEEAIEKAENGEFNEDNPICDQVLCGNDAIHALLDDEGKLANIWSIEDVQTQIDYFNEENGTDFSMSEDEMTEILEDAIGDFDYQTSEINNSLQIEVENRLTEILNTKKP